MISYYMIGCSDGVVNADSVTSSEKPTFITASLFLSSSFESVEQRCCMNPVC